MRVKRKGKKEMIHRFSVTVFVISLYASYVRMDEYIDEFEDSCTKNYEFISCGKYKMLRYLSYVIEPLNNTTIQNLRFVKLEQQSNVTEQMFTSSRHLTIDTEYTKFMKFLKRKVNNYINNQALAIELPDDIKIIHSGNEVGEFSIFLHIT